MKKSFLFFAMLCTNMLQAQYVDLNQWDLVFQDEFTSTQTFDAANPNAPWVTGLLWEGEQTHGEPQYYTRYNKSFSTTCDKGGINHVINNGVLSLQARKEPNKYYQVFNWPNGIMTSTCDKYDYTSACISTKMAYKFGYFEIRCKIPNQGKVLFPAFWLYSGNPIEGQQGSYRELDIFEFIGDTPNLMGTNLHFSKGLMTRNWSAPDAQTITNNQYNANLGNADISNQFHNYAVRWSPYSVTWYFDGVPVRTVNNQVPQWDMYLLVNLALSPWTSLATTDAALPAQMDIDYVRIYKPKPHQEFAWQSGVGEGMIGSYTFNSNTDRFLAVDYDGDGIDEVQAISNKNSAYDNSQTLKYNCTTQNWETIWTNPTTDMIGGWYINTTDRFVAGDFDHDGKEEIQCFKCSSAMNDYSQTLKMVNGNWQTVWSTTGNDLIGNWYMNPTDKFVAGDFDADGRSEIQCFSTTSGMQDYSQTLKMVNGNWQTVWSNPGNDLIGNWYMNPPDVFIGGDFDGDGRDEIQTFSLTSAFTDWSQTLKFVNNNWQTIWSNTGNDLVGYWSINPGDKFKVLDFNSDGKKDIMCTAANGWVQILSFASGSWQTIWANDGANRIDMWFMNTSDQYLTGNFCSNPAIKLLALSAMGSRQEIKIAGSTYNQRIGANDVSEDQIPASPVYTIEENSIFPNPVTSGSVVHFAHIINNYQLRAMTGQIIAEGQQTDVLNIDSLAKGIYILELDGKAHKLIVE